MSAFDGKRAMDGQSAMDGENPAFKALRLMEDIGKTAFNLTFPGMVKELYEVYKVKAKSDKDLKQFEKACEHAIKLAKQDRQKDAVYYMQNVLSSLDTAGAFKDVTNEFQQILESALKEMQENDKEGSIEADNALSRESFEKLCKEKAAELRESDPEAAAAWDAMKGLVGQAYDQAEAKNEPMALEMTETDNQNLDAVMKNLNAVGIPTQVFYGDPMWDKTAKGMVVTPALSDEAKERVIGAVKLARIKRMRENIVTREMYDIVSKILPTNMDGKRYDEHLQISGLTKAEAELMRERLFKKSDIEFPVAVIESPDGDGTWAVLYPKGEERRVHQEFAACLLLENGYGRMTNMEEMLIQQANERSKVQVMITMLAQNKDEQFIIVDPDSAAGKGDNNAQTPGHYLRIDRGYLRECRATYDEKTGEWTENVVSSINLSKPHQGLTNDDIIRDKILSFSRNPVMLRENYAERLGITRDSFAPTPKFNAYIQKMTDPAKAGLINGEEYSKEERQMLMDQVNAQRSFAEFASKEAARVCKDDPSVENIMEFIKKNPNYLIEQYHKTEKKKLDKLEAKGKDVSFDRERLERRYNLLKNNSDRDFGVIACMEQAEAVVTDRIITQVYESDPFTAGAIDSAGIDEKEIFDVQRAVERARAMAQTPLAQNAFQAAVRNEKKKTLDEKMVNYKMIIKRKNPQLPESSLDVRAAAYAFTENIHDAVFKGAEFADSSEAAGKYGFNFDQAAQNIDQMIFEKHGFHIEEILDEDAKKFMSKEELIRMDKAKDAIDPAIRTEVVRQMKESRGRDAIEQEH